MGWCWGYGGDGGDAPARHGRPVTRSDLQMAATEGGGGGAGQAVDPVQEQTVLWSAKRAHVLGLTLGPAANGFDVYSATGLYEIRQQVHLYSCTPSTHTQR